MRDFLNITLFLVLAACSAEEKAEKPEISRAKDLPKVREMMESFHAQENRLTISGCEFNYNDNSFRLGVSVEEMVNILGPYDDFKVNDYSYQYMEKCPGPYSALSYYFDSRGSSFLASVAGACFFNFPPQASMHPEMPGRVCLLQKRGVNSSTMAWPWD